MNLRTPPWALTENDSAFVYTTQGSTSDTEYRMMRMIVGASVYLGVECFCDDDGLRWVERIVRWINDERLWRCGEVWWGCEIWAWAWVQHRSTVCASGQWHPFQLAMSIWRLALDIHWRYRSQFEIGCRCLSLTSVPIQNVSNVHSEFKSIISNISVV